MNIKNSGDWSKSRIEEFLGRPGLKYQKIELPYGLSTPGAERKETCDLIFSDGVEGKSVLDIGSYLGYFCIKAAERGASRVLGWEINEESIDNARTIAEIKGLNIEYVKGDIEKDDPGEKYDLVLCLNLLHHMKDPIAVLDKLIRITRETLVLEVATLGAHDRRKLGLSRFRSSIISGSPAVIVGRGATSKKLSGQKKFFFTEKALKNLLLYQRNSFGDVRFYKTGFKDRFLVIAKKRRAGHLVVVSGPTSSGKTTLIKSMMSNSCPAVSEKLGVGDFSGWLHLGSSQLNSVSSVFSQGIILHYDFLRPYGRSAKTHDRDEALDILKNAEKISFLTIYSDPSKLRKQLMNGEILRKKKGLKKKAKKIVKVLLDLPGFRLVRKIKAVEYVYSKASKDIPGRLTAILDAYEDPGKVYGWYRAWFDYIGGLKLNVLHNLVADTRRGSFSVYPASDWEADRNK
ncbi:MAG: methyltransferase domain-containing protein [Elusimicrobia bacterium]|nr:methyltransferase domain-containing protein [Elusimicrobiota bacterium]